MEESIPEAAVDADSVKFFRKLDWSAFWTACAVSFAVYVYTLAPTVTLEDSGELAVASDMVDKARPEGTHGIRSPCRPYTGHAQSGTVIACSISAL